MTAQATGCRFSKIRKNTLRSLHAAHGGARDDARELSSHHTRGATLENRIEQFPVHIVLVRKYHEADDRTGGEALCQGPVGFEEGIYDADESSGEDRSYVAFDDMSQLKGKRVLIVEDDVHTGATLRKILEEITPGGPAFLGLYLGSPNIRQQQQNIPDAFREVYVSDWDMLEDEVFLNHLRGRTVIFKDDVKPASFRK